MTDKDLLKAAIEARKNAYAPYSDFAVGAALLTKSGEVYSGVNIESSSYPAGICAERAALSGAVTAGDRDFSTIAVTGWKRDEEGHPCIPCGICRQALYEFNSELRVITGTPDDIHVFALKDLLPYGFGL